MTKFKNKITEIVGEIVDMLNPLSSEERQRVISASLVLLGETMVKDINGDKDKDNSSEDSDGLPDRARTWIKQNNLSFDNIQQSFYVTKEQVDVIVADMPGKNKKEKTINAYVLSGIAKLLLSGDTNFNDKSARALCESSGCYDSANHAVYLKGKGNEFTGTKAKGWTLTAPGLKRGAMLIKELNK